MYVHTVFKEITGTPYSSIGTCLLFIFFFYCHLNMGQTLREKCNEMSRGGG